ATITGKDQAGNALTETLTLSNNGTFVTEHVFASVTDITTSGGMGAQAQLSAAIEPLQQPTVGNLVTAINAAGLSHGVQAALDTQGRFIVYSAPTNYGPDGTALGTPAQVVGNGELGLTSATTFQGGGAITITGPAGTATFNTFAGEGVGQLIQQVNSANLGLTASINSIGQFQLTTLTNGTGQKITIAGAAGNDITTLLGVANGTVTGLDRGFLPS